MPPAFDCEQPTPEEPRDEPAPSTAAPAPPDPLVPLLAAVAAGDRAAFKRLYDATSPKLLGMAMLLLRRRDAAEDVLQDGYLRIWSKAAHYDPARGAPWPWLAQIVRNVALDRMKRERVAHDDIAEHADRLPAIIGSLGDRMDLQRCLATLGAAQREAVLLTYLHGFTNEELAAHLGAPLGTVKAWVRRSAERLRVQLGA